MVRVIIHKVQIALIAWLRQKTTVVPPNTCNYIVRYIANAIIIVQGKLRAVMHNYSYTCLIVPLPAAVDFQEKFPNQ